MNNLVISNPAAIAPPGQIISDSELAHRATSLLRWKIRYNSIRIEAQNGHVILSGKVDWPSDITTAEQTIRKLSGVLGVTNRIVARLPVASDHRRKKLSG
jgi:osmotically-inducible protein OsmY